MKYKTGDKVLVWSNKSEIYARRTYSQKNTIAILINVEIIGVIPNYNSENRYIVSVPKNIPNSWTLSSKPDFAADPKWHGARCWNLYGDDAIFGLAKKIKCKECNGI